MDLSDLITAAEALLPGEALPDDETDPRWQAMHAIADHIEEEPEQVWDFVARWGGHPQDDLRMAIATCLLEHLLEHHFELIFPRVAASVVDDRLFADTFSHCWKFGQSMQPGNERKFDALQGRCGRGHDKV